MVKIGQNHAMSKIADITSVGFNPPRDTRLAVEAMSIDELRQRAPADHFNQLQRADFYRLIGVLEGQTCPMVDFSTIAAKPGDWLLVRPGQIFRYDFSRSWVGWIVVFRPDGLDILPKLDDLLCLRSLNAEQQDWMSRCMQQLHKDGALSTDVGLRNALLRLQLSGTLLRLWHWQSLDVAPGSYATAELSNFRRFRNLLELNFASQHQVQHYASTLGMSEKTLSRLCAATTGVPAKTVIQQRVALEAKRLLAHTHLAVQTVGQELGFEDPTNFVKFFRKETGMTPLAFRASQKAIPDNRPLAHSDSQITGTQFSV
jgi:AraC-like DNA-binding protein